MSNAQNLVIVSLLSLSAVTWILSYAGQDDMMMNMMIGMMIYEPVAILLFTASWTVMMAAMMFPAIIPMVLHYDSLVKGNSVGINLSRERTLALDVDHSVRRKDGRTSSMISFASIKTVSFVGLFLAIWAMAGIALLLVWSIPLNYLISHLEARQEFMIYGSILIVAGIYQFSPPKRKWLGYCCFPGSFFKRYNNNNNNRTSGAIKLGTCYGFYCFGCCWPYFLLMVALGWMSILWMVLFTAIIVTERVWNRGIWISRSVGVGFAIVGIMAMLGLIPIDLGMDLEMNSGMDMEMKMNSGMDMKTNSGMDMEMNSDLDMKMNDLDLNTS